MFTPIKDVEVPDSALKSLILQKHCDYIAAYGAKKEDYV
jgi:geranylgeranyl transferase type-2 subunit beta